MYANYFVDTKRGVLSNINNNLVYETFPLRGDGSGKSTLTDAQQREQHNVLKMQFHKRVIVKELL